MLAEASGREPSLSRSADRSVAAPPTGSCLELRGRGTSDVYLIILSVALINLPFSSLMIRMTAADSDIREADPILNPEAYGVDPEVARPGRLVCFRRLAETRSEAASWPSLPGAGSLRSLYSKWFVTCTRTLLVLFLNISHCSPAGGASRDY